MNHPRTTLPSSLSPELLNLSDHDSDAFREAIDRDFGGAIDDPGDGFSRRRWLQLMGASLALGGVAGCRYEEEEIATFAFRPQNRIPGIPQHYATMIELDGVAQPLLSTSYDGRPIKLDGNPRHPESKGASTKLSQARMLEFYDPDRLRSSLRASEGGLEEATFESFIEDCRFGGDAKGTAILAEPTSSPTMNRLRGLFVQQGGQWMTFSPVNDDNSRAGIKLACGEVLRPHYDLDCNVIVSIDADPLLMDRGSVANAISFANGRDADHGRMSRLYAIESQFSTTGSAADHRLAVRSSDIPGLVASLTAADFDNPVQPTAEMSYRDRVFAALVADLADPANRGKSVIIAGEQQPPEVHALVHSLNEKLGNVGQTVTYSKVADPDRTDSLASIQAFAEGLKSGAIRRAIILGGNPVYHAPASLKLEELLAKAETSAHISFYRNETGLACQWISAVAHPLESWQDGVTYQGSTLVGQPLINPLFGGKSEIETLATLMGLQETSGQALIRETLGLGQTAWTEAVHHGFIQDSAGELVTPTIQNTPEIEATDAWKTEWDGQQFELVFKPCQSIHDGRFANNAWLQECPDFFTKVTWDNVAQVSPETARKLGVTQRGMAAKSTTTMINITVGGETRKVPIAIQPGQADGSIGLAIGYGRTAAGRVGGDIEKNIDPVGHNIVPLRTVEDWHVMPVDPSAVASSGTRYQLAIVQEPWAIDEVAREEIQARMFRDSNKSETDRSGLIREGTFDSYQEYLEHHPMEDQHAAAKTANTAALAAYATGANGELPILNQVSYTPGPTPTAVEDDEEQGHGGAHGWPEAFHMHHELFDLTPGVREDYAADNPAHTNVWGMSIDLNKCIGCNSCVIACQSENNIPVVGKSEVWRGRELHWIRIDRYYGHDLYTDDADGEQIVHQPVACHHCENAPCETVCPVAATVHSSEGLNDMVYNRCIGTRYCGNNCPYKVRRFNYLNYSDADTFIKYPGADKLDPADLQLQNLMMNPDVTIRSRGVMEKCTYCVQRIQQAKIEHKNKARDHVGQPHDEEIKVDVACQVACPTSAIKFGDLNRDNEVSRAHANPRAYTMLEELNNRPRTKYLARVRNPHPMLIDHDDRDSKPNHGSEAGHAGGDDHAKDEAGAEVGDTSTAKDH